MHKGEKIKIQLWDVTGGKRFADILTNYCNDIIGAMILFDVSDIVSFNNISLWYTTIKKVSPNCPIVICGYKIDGIRKIPYKDCVNISKELGCVYTEATSTSVPSVNNAIECLLSQIRFDLKNKDNITIRVNSIKKDTSGIKN